MDENELLKVLELSQQISDLGPKAVNDLQVIKKKRLFSLIIEAFRSFSAFSRLIRSHYLVQSCAVLRLFVEQTSKVVILEQHPELYDGFERHCQVREKVIDMSQKERKLVVLEEFGLDRKQHYQYALSYLDYGWIKPLSKEGLYGYHEMIKTACVEDSSILRYIDSLDQFIHQNVDSHSITNEGFIEFEKQNIYLSLLTFEKLLVSFSNLCLEKKLMFAINGKKVLEEIFWPEYEKIIKPEDRIS